MEGVAAGGGEGHHGRRRDGARQAQFAVTVHCTGSTGLSVGAGTASMPHGRRQVSVRRTEQGLSGLPTDWRERSRDGGSRPTHCPRLALPSDGFQIRRFPKTDSPRPSWPGPTDQDGPLHSVAGASNDETAGGTNTSQTPVESRCRIDSQRFLPIGDGSRCRIAGGSSRRDGGGRACSKSWSHDAERTAAGKSVKRPMATHEQVGDHRSTGEGDFQTQSCRVNEKGN